MDRAAAAGLLAAVAVGWCGGLIVGPERAIVQRDGIEAGLVSRGSAQRRRVWLTCWRRWCRESGWLASGDGLEKLAGIDLLAAMVQRERLACWQC